MTGTASRLADLLAECKAHGIRLLPANDGGLTIDGPRDALTPDLLRRLKAHKADVLAMLRDVATSEAAACIEPSTGERYCDTRDEWGFPLAAGERLVEWPGGRSAAVTALPRRPAAPQGACCPRCRSSQFIDVPIHGGRSTRRECGRCGRFLGFPDWYRTDALQNAM